MVINKYQRYMQKCVREGRCPHCGKPCAPYYECDTRRGIKRVTYYLKKLEKAGVVERIKTETGTLWRHTGKPPKYKVVSKRSGGPNDFRHMPRRPQAIVDYLNSLDPATLKELEDGLPPDVRATLGMS